jgi:ribonuclease P protein component
VSGEAQVKRCFRLTRSNDIKRVRRSGKSYAHPLVVLYALPAESLSAQIGIIASGGVGNAVRRNRAKRILRAAASELLPMIKHGYHLLLIARPSLPDVDKRQAGEALSELLRRAGLLELHDDH